MPKGDTSRPFNKPTRELAKKKVRTRTVWPFKPLSVANEHSEHEEGLRKTRKFLQETSNSISNAVTPGKWTSKPLKK